MEKDSAKTETNGKDQKDSDGNGGKKKKNRCLKCNKKVGLTGFPCRCGGLFCSLHRYRLVIFRYFVQHFIKKFDRLQIIQYIHYIEFPIKLFDKMVQVLSNLKNVGRLFCPSAKSGKNLKSRFPEQLSVRI